MTSARLPEELEQRLDIAVKAKHITKTEFIREAVAVYLSREETEKSSWELGEPYFGKYGSGDGGLSANYKTRIKEKLHAKHHPH
ncbi:ribbon-helix-helix domain-containing protein [Treponema primitia]|uniref:CopG family transcriptional regulator n=1 Tax=Treponema primitia TaxID=88058 RepID=UPI0039806034